jgi:hypothetical protein
MAEDSTVNQDKFDAILKRLITAKPQTGEETKAKATAQRKAKKQKATSQRNTKE